MNCHANLPERIIRQRESEAVRAKLCREIRLMAPHLAQFLSWYRNGAGLEEILRRLKARAG